MKSCEVMSVSLSPLSITATIVAWPHQGRGIVCGKCLGQSIDQTKLPYLVDFHFCFIYTYIYFSLYILYE